MNERNANIDFCGIVNLLQCLIADGYCTEKEAKRIQSRIAAKIGADIILSR